MMFAALAAVVVMSSCNVNDDINESENQPVRFTAGIGDAVATPQGSPETRAAGTAWGNGDAIGIFMVANGGTTTVHAGNKQYTTTGGSTFTPAAGDEIYYPMDGSKVDFIAYYPYNSSNTTLGSIDVTIGNQTAQPSFDLLWTKVNKGGSGYTKGDAVALTFDHKLAKIVMKTKKDASISGTLAGMTVTIKGMNTKNTFDLSSGALGTPDTDADITPKMLTDGSQYDAIILPGSYGAGAVTVDFTVNGETFTWTLPATSFDGGNEYTYTVTLKRTGVTATGTINAWITTNNDRGNVDAE